MIDTPTGPTGPTVEIRQRESVILATDVRKLVAWYRDVLGMKLVRAYDEDYHYCNLETSTGICIGIADAAQMKVNPVDRSQNTVLLQIEVDDVAVFFRQLEEKGGSITFGPSLDAENGFYYGGFSDPEGNPWWVVDAKCP